MGSVVLLILMSRLLVYSAGSEVNRVQIVLSGFSVRLLCFVQAITCIESGMVVCIYLLHSRLRTHTDITPPHHSRTLYKPPTHSPPTKRKRKQPSHPLHKHTTYHFFNTIFNNHRYTTNIPICLTTADLKTNIRRIHIYIVSMHLATRGNNTILHTAPPHISSSEEILPLLTRRTHALSQIILTQSRRQITSITTHTHIISLTATHTHHVVIHGFVVQTRSE